MQALIIIAHGSRHAASNQEIIDLVESLKIILKDDFSLITHAFLEFTSPTIHEAFNFVFDKNINKVADMDSVTVMPLFIAAGKHVKKDIPLAIADAFEQWPSKEIILKAHLGALSGMPLLIKEGLITYS